MKTSWKKKVSNEDVLRRAQTERKLMKQIVKRLRNSEETWIKEASTVKW